MSGSGLGTRLTELIRDAYPTVTVLNVVRVQEWINVIRHSSIFSPLLLCPIRWSGPSPPAR